MKKLNDLNDIEVNDVELPAEIDSSHGVHQTIYDKTLSYYFQDEFKKPELVSPINNTWE